MIDRGWSEHSPKSGTYTVFNITDYSSGEAEVSVTTVKDSECYTKKVIDKELMHERLLDSVPYDSDEAERLIIEATELKEISELDKEENKQRSLRRAKSVIRKKIIEGELDHFLTLTYKENKTDLQECWKDWKKFIRLVQQKYPALKYLVIVERQKRGAIHFHAAIHGFMHANAIRSLWLQVVGAGNIDLKRKKDGQSIHSLAKYICKYLTKQYDELDDFKNLYRCSQNIKLKQMKFYLPKEYALFRADEIEKALAIFIKDIKQFWEDSNGLYSCQWASSLSP